MQKPTEIQFRSLAALLNNSNDSNIVEMLSAYLQMDKTQIGIIDAVRMDVNLVDRLDKLCVRYYGTIDYLDLLLEFNDITNPFDVPYGMILFIPDKNNLLDGTKTVTLNKIIRAIRTNNNTISDKSSATDKQIKANFSTNFATKKSSVRSALNTRGTGMKYDGKKIVF